MADKQGGFSLSIFGRVLVMMVVVALIPLGGLIYISGYQHQNDWRQSVNQTLDLNAAALATKVDGWIDTNRRALGENAAIPDVLSMDTGRQKPVLKAIQGAYSWAYLVFTVSPDGRNIGRSDENPLTTYGDRAYFKEVMAGSPVGHEVVIGRTSGKPALILAGPIGAGAGQVGGVIALAMHLVDISDAVVRTRIGNTGYAILVDKNNKLIAHGRPQLVSEALQDMSAHPALRAGDSAGPVVFEDKGKRVVAVTRKTDLGWTLIVQQDQDEAFAPLLQSRRDSMILVGVALALVMLLASVLARQLARPIVALTKAADELSRGAFDTQILGTARQDEIGALARAIERLAISIRMAFERLRKKA